MNKQQADAKTDFAISFQDSKVQKALAKDAVRYFFL